MMKYTLKLTAADVAAVEFAFGCYAWPRKLLDCLDRETDTVEMTESDAWEWCDDVAADCEGGHSPFALAAPSLGVKLMQLHMEVI